MILIKSPNLKGDTVKYSWTDNLPDKADQNKRSTERRPVAMSARLTWKDARGAARFATVVARNVSEFGVYVECQSPVSIPLYRLVQFQFEPTVRSVREIPDPLRQGRVLSAVYRVSPASQQAGHGLALRLLVEPRRMAAAAPEAARATA